MDNERSALLLTSQSLIKGAELKNTNAKFYEEELRKLRLIMDKWQQEADENERNLRAEIKHLQEEI